MVDHGLAGVSTVISAFGQLLSLSLIAIYTLRAVLWLSMSTLASKHHGIISLPSLPVRLGTTSLVYFSQFFLSLCFLSPKFLYFLLMCLQRKGSFLKTSSELSQSKMVNWTDWCCDHTFTWGSSLLMNYTVCAFIRCVWKTQTGTVITSIVNNSASHNLGPLPVFSDNAGYNVHFM